MNTRMIAAALTVLTFFAAPAARAEGEGNGDPFPFAAPATVFRPGRFLADTGSDALPNLRGQAAHTLPTAELATLPVTGSDGAIQIANSLPVRALEGTSVYAQSQAAAQFFAARDAHAPMTTASRLTRFHGG